MQYKLTFIYNRNAASHLFHAEWQADLQTRFRSAKSRSSEVAVRRAIYFVIFDKIVVIISLTLTNYYNVTGSKLHNEI